MSPVSSMSQQQALAEAARHAAYAARHDEIQAERRRRYEGALVVTAMCGDFAAYRRELAAIETWRSEQLAAALEAREGYGSLVQGLPGED